MEKELKPEENVKTKPEEEAKDKDKKSFRHKLEAKEAEIEKWKADANHWKNEYFRAYADTQNLRKSVERELSEGLKYRAEGFVGDLLPVLDGFYFALAMEPANPELKNYLIGFQYIYQNILSVLEKEGVKEIAPKEGEAFDVKTMHAVEAQETEGPPNKIVKVLNKGYKLKDRLVRPANVIVSKSKLVEVTKEDGNTQLDTSVKKDA
ncbi:MAG: nucleotide exchange factor GrpE [Methanomicrobia archaeon]|nr:nucleotide exchange factor GrpE [Methanomicrobia archaeon]